jgi:hypothetical protein
MHECVGKSHATHLSVPCSTIKSQLPKAGSALNSILVRRSYDEICWCFCGDGGCFWRLRAQLAMQHVQRASCQPLQISIAKTGLLRDGDDDANDGRLVVMDRRRGPVSR